MRWPWCGTACRVASTPECPLAIDSGPAGRAQGAVAPAAAQATAAINDASSPGARFEGGPQELLSPRPKKGKFGRKASAGKKKQTRALGGVED